MVAVPVRHPGRWVSAVVIVVLIAMLVHGLVTNPNFQWDVVKQWFFSGPILKGLVVTLELTVIAMFIGVVLGVILAVMRLSTNPIVSSASWVYIWFFRGTPVLVQLLIWFNLAALYSVVSLGVPFGPEFVTFNTNSLIAPLVAAILGLGLNEAAYMAEIIRAGILSVDQGQTEAAQALGMSRLKTMRRIVLPQAMRVVVPAHRQRDDLHAQDHLARERHRRDRAVVRSTDHLRPDVPDHPVADRRGDLVPDPDLRPVLRAVLRGALLRAWCGSDDAAHPAAEASSTAGRDARAARRPTRPQPRGHPMTIPMVKAEAVRKSFGAVEVLSGIDLEVKRGEVFCLIGPSGSGKSTFLRCINHLEKISAGRLWVDDELVGYRQKGDKLYELRDREVCAKRSEIGMVFQHFNLFPHKTALGNVIEAPMQVKGESKAIVLERARSCSTGWGSETSAMPTRASCPAVSSSGSRSPGRWRCSPS